MYLKTLQIKKFRSISEMEINFNKGMNILIGENNAGKTAIIDALRICLSHGRQWKDIGVRFEEDFHIDSSDINCTPQPIEFDLIFAVENDEDRRFFTSMIWQDPGDPTHQNIQLHFRYEVEQTVSGVKKMRWRSWGGEMEGQPIDTNEAQLIYYTYLAPLRNAEQELRPYAKDNKITSLFRDLTSFKMLDAAGATVTQNLDDAQKLALAAKLETVVNGNDWSGLIGTGTSLINEHLEKADIRSKFSSVHLRLTEYKYDNIVKAIMTRKPVFATALLPAGQEHMQRHFDVSQNGLGDNNLIFAAAVLGDLKNRRAEKKEHYYSLLIEEPEAHLHPQRQNTFFNYLNNLRELDLQLFVTSHSPTLTAKSNLDDLIVIQQVPGVNHPYTLKNSELSALNKSYLQKFLDVTKSQLFFSNGTILVEGISEALLLPVLAKIVNLEYDLEQNGVEVVNIGGVAFEPFAKLYNSADVEKRLASRCAILTDDDRGNLTASNFINVGEGITKAIATLIYAKLKADEVVDNSNRIVNEAGYVFADAALNQYAVFVNATINARRTQVSPRAVNAISYPGGNLRAELAVYTFEYELMIASEINYRLMFGLYRTMHPRTTFLLRTDPMKSRALEFVAKLDENKDKSEFAQRLSGLLTARHPKSHFVVPTYITNALRWVIEGI